MEQVTVKRDCRFVLIFLEADYSVCTNAKRQSTELPDGFKLVFL